MNNLVFNLAYKIKKIHKETTKLSLEAKKKLKLSSMHFFSYFYRGIFIIIMLGGEQFNILSNIQKKKGLWHM